MPIAVSCPCGRSYRVSDEHGGKRIRCKDCSKLIEVPLPEAELDESPPAEASAMAVQSEKPRFRLPLPDEAPLPPPPTKRRRRRRRDDGGFSISISPAIFTGLGMMLAAVVWFVLGLFFGWIFFYPPILFVLGCIVFVKSLMGYED